MSSITSLPRSGARDGIETGGGNHNRSNSNKDLRKWEQAIPFELREPTFARKVILVARYAAPWFLFILAHETSPE